MIETVGPDFAAASKNLEIKGEIARKFLNDLQGRFLKHQPNVNDLQGRDGLIKQGRDGNVFSPLSRVESLLKIRCDLNYWKRMHALVPRRMSARYPRNVLDPRLPLGPVQDMVALAVNEEGDGNAPIGNIKQEEVDDNAPIGNIKQEEADSLDLSGDDDDASVSLEAMEAMLRREKEETKKEIQKAIDRLKKRRGVLATENNSLEPEDL